MKKARELFQYLIRLDKNDAAFFYFQLEANDNLCFYSTLDSIEGCPYRDLEIMGTKEFEQDFLYLLKQIQNEFPIQIIDQKTIFDGEAVSNG